MGSLAAFSGVAKMVPIFLSSLVSIFVLYNQYSNASIQRVIVVLLIVVMILMGNIAFIRRVSILNKLYVYVIVFLTSLLVQLIVVSSGGFYSPLLILIHLMILGLGFFVGDKVSLVFLLFSLIVLGANIKFNDFLLGQFNEDPWSLMLYTASFVVIIPLAHLLTKTYNLKDTLLRKFKEYAQITEMREESLMRSLDELVLVTNGELKLLSVNEAVEKFLRLSQQDIRNKNLLEVVDLRDEKGNKADSRSLSIENILSDKSTRIIENYFLYSASKPHPIEVTLQVRPIKGEDGEINQIIFVITEAKVYDSSSKHFVVQQAHLRNKFIIENLSKNLSKVSVDKLKTELWLINKRDEDLFLVQELEDHLIVKEKFLVDLAELCDEVVKRKSEFARALGVNLQFLLPQGESKESTLIGLKNTGSTMVSNLVSGYSAPMDKKWFTNMMNSLVDIMIFVATNESNPTVILTPKVKDSRTVLVEVDTPTTLSGDLNTADFFTQGYGEVAKVTNVLLGSGLEGFIAKVISDQLDIKLGVRVSLGRLVLSAEVSRGPSL